MPSTRTSCLPETAPLARVWDRLQTRVQASVEAGRALVTVRADEMARHELPGAEIRHLYAATGAVRRQGEAERLRLLDLAPGARLSLPVQAGADSLWLVLAGSATVAGQDLRRLEAWQGPVEGPAEVSTVHGARLLVREDSRSVATNGPRRWSARPCTGHAWLSAHPGVHCRRMGPPGEPGPYLLQLDPGCVVPVHRHARDEECLMLAGEMYVDDQLLLAGDYQVAKAGGVHRSIQTDRGALVLVHGDPEPELLNPAEL